MVQILAIAQKTHLAYTIARLLIYANQSRLRLQAQSQPQQRVVPYSRHVQNKAQLASTVAMTIVFVMKAAVSLIPVIALLRTRVAISARVPIPVHHETPAANLTSNLVRRVTPVTPTSASVSRKEMELNFGGATRWHVLQVSVIVNVMNTQANTSVVTLTSAMIFALVPSRMVQPVLHATPMGNVPALVGYVSPKRPTTTLLVPLLEKPVIHVTSRFVNVKKFPMEIGVSESVIVYTVKTQYVIARKIPTQATLIVAKTGTYVPTSVLVRSPKV